MASAGNQHCANCIGTLSFPVAAVFRQPAARRCGGRKACGKVPRVRK